MNSRIANSTLVAESPETAAVRLPNAGALGIWGGTIFLSAFLLFQVQPVLAKIILPWFGGGAGVWTTSLVFFQVTYLLGNLYAHWLIGCRKQAWALRAHIGLLAASLFLLPILPGAAWKPAGSVDPALHIFALLAVKAGLPFFLLSATSPLLQAWYVRSERGVWPYRFYSLSNAGSLLALLSYPVLVEPHSTTRHQAFAWSFAYTVFAAVCGWMAFRQRSNSAPVGAGNQPQAAPSWKTLLLWTALAADASALLVAVTTHISQDVAAVPLLWIVPLSLYLLSLILCFESERWYRRPIFLRFLAVALAGMVYALSPQFANAGPLLKIPLYCVGLFICCMVCHGELTRRKPHPHYLTSFYLMIAAGGALGGIFVGVIAPRIFDDFYELPIALAGCAVLTLICVMPASSAFIKTARRQAAFYGIASAFALGLAFLPYFAKPAYRVSATLRNFYGVLRVDDYAATANEPARRFLINGTIVHGVEWLDATRGTKPTTYFGPESGAAVALNDMHQRGSIHAGIIGLGTGTLATYGRPGDRFTFYEMNPLVVQVASTDFDFLRHSGAKIDIVPGDARISLEREPKQDFDVLMVDAFSGDAIPVHLLTREAFELYFRHLKPEGLLAMHISNKFLNLKPVVEAAARLMDAKIVTITNDADHDKDIYTATWVLLYRDRPAPKGTTDDNATPHWSRSDATVRPWTDDYSSLLSILR
jgi:hypothetical protein